MKISFFNSFQTYFHAKKLAFFRGVSRKITPIPVHRHEKSGKIKQKHKDFTKHSIFLTTHFIITGL